MDSAVDILRDALDDVVDVDLGGLSDGEVHRGLVGLVELRNVVDAAILKLAGEWTRRGIWAEDGSRAAGARLARETRLRTAAAYRLVHQAAELAGMPLVAAALAAGQITVDHVGLLAGANTDSRRDCFERDESRLVGLCVELPWWATVKALRYWTDRVDALTGDDDGPPPRWRNRQARSHRGIDDEVHVEAIFDAVGGATFAAVWERIDNELRLADENNPDAPPRTPTQRRLDALVEMAIRATSTNAGGGGGRPRPLVTVAVGDHSFRRLCELSDGTVISPGELIPYVGDLDVNAILFNGPLHAIAGSPTRTFGGLLRRAIEVRDRVCQHPASDGDPINRCDVDHIVPAATGGATCQHNGQLLETGRNRDPHRRNLTAADITVWDDDPIAITTRQRLQTLINQHPRPPSPN